MFQAIEGQSEAVSPFGSAEFVPVLEHRRPGPLAKAGETMTGWIRPRRLTTAAGAGAEDG